jgi:hypothetical protein
MVETNIRVVSPGNKLCVWTRRARVTGSHITADLLEKACGRLRYERGLAAVRIAGLNPDGSGELLVATFAPIPNIRLEGEDWVLNVADAGQPAKQLTLADPGGNDVLPTLMERAVLATLARQRRLWTLDSPRIWYEPQPFQSASGIDAYRRYQVSSIILAGVGVGIIADVGTAFFTTQTLAYYFDPTVPEGERQHRIRRFTQLTQRQKRQKGTLLYDIGYRRMSCYFAGAKPGVTCVTTGPVQAKGQTYASLYEYYQQNNPGLHIAPDAVAVQVSFRGMDRPQWVAAECLRVRIMNNQLPGILRNVDKISPGVRRKMLQDFWLNMGDRPLGSVAPGLVHGFWRPGHERVIMLSMPSLTFGQKVTLPAPSSQNAACYEKSFKLRGESLDHLGCYKAPATASRTIHFVHPSSVTNEACAQLAADITGEINRLTGCAFDFEIVPYDSLDAVLEELRSAGKPGMAVFVLNSDPDAYYEVSLQLDRWRVKRITDRTLTEHYSYLKYGYNSKKTGPLDRKRGKSRWTSFVSKNALKILQLLDAVPYRLEQAGPYEAQLVIDVGHDRRYSALSLLIARSSAKSPNFLIASQANPKAEHHEEAINPVLLSRHMTALVNSVISHRADPLASLLVVRDGRFCGQETEGVATALDELRRAGKVAKDARIDLVDLHKDSLKWMRMWNVTETSGGTIVANPLEGTALHLNPNMVMVATTGAATLRQGTTNPIVLVAQCNNEGLIDAAQAIFSGAQLNWSSPNVAQRLSLSLRRTDEELKTRTAQQIGRFR